MTAENLNIMYRRAGLFRRLAGSGLVLMAAYLYLVNGTVFALVARERAIEEIDRRRSGVVALETEYLERSSAITMALAEQLGFRDAAGVTLFVEAAPPAPVVALVH